MTQPRAVIYAREDYMTQPLKDQNGDWPQKLTSLIAQAGAVPRPFETVVVATPAVLGTPEEAQEVADKLAEYGITVRPADEQPVGTRPQRGH